MATNKKTAEKSNGKKRYNEKDVVKRFLVSERGITFLVDHAREGKRVVGEVPICPGKKAMREQVTNIVDYYFAWINHFPVRKNMRISKYSFLKHLEDLCSKKEIGCLFDFLFT